MIFRRPAALALILACFAWSGTASGAEKAASDAAKPAAGEAKAKDAKASASAQPARDVQVLLDQFKDRRDAFLAKREMLEKRLKEANEAEKKAILDQIESQQKELLDEQRAMGKRIRDEMRKLRGAAQTPPRR